jgi:FkbM family methyltransferase
MAKNAIRSLLAKSIPRKIRKLTPKFISRHLYFKGAFQISISDSIKLNLHSEGYILENEMYWYGIEGGHEKESIKLWMSYIQSFKPNSIFDIGANTGIYGLIAQSLAPDSIVTYFEPLPTAASILDINLKSNSFDGVIYQVALSNYDGQGKFNLNGDDDFAYSITLNTYADLAILGTHDSSKSYHELEVKVCRLATLLDEGRLLVPNLMKLDVETSEFEVLTGMDGYIWEVSAFLVEVLNSEQAKKLNTLFGGKDYRFFNIDDTKSAITEYRNIVSTPHYNYFIVEKSLVSNFQYLKSKLGID